MDKVSELVKVGNTSCVCAHTCIHIDDAALRMITRSVCGCFGEILTYECTVLGGSGGATIWTGSALTDCPSNEIVLLHQRFTGTIRSCNNGATVAQSLHVQNNLYTSQLNITITLDTTEKTIMCVYDDMDDDTDDGIPANNMSQFLIQLPGIVQPARIS